MRLASRRVLVLSLVALALAAIVSAWLWRVVAPPQPEDRAREEAVRIQERARNATH
jgi:hypothetical protein